jgi:hypothetical protein
VLLLAFEEAGGALGPLAHSAIFDEDLGLRLEAIGRVVSLSRTSAPEYPVRDRQHTRPRHGAVKQSSISLISIFLLSCECHPTGTFGEGGSCVLKLSQCSPWSYVIQCSFSPRTTATLLSYGLFKIPSACFSSDIFFQPLPASCDRHICPLSSSCTNATPESSKYRRLTRSFSKGVVLTSGSLAAADDASASRAGSRRPLRYLIMHRCEGRRLW